MESKKAFKELEAILEKEYKEHPQNFETGVYWNYDEKISLDDLSKSKTFEEFEENLSDELYIMNDPYICELRDDVASNFTSEHENLYDELNEYDKENFYDLLLEHISVDLNIDSLLNNRANQLYVNVFPYQEENLNCEGGELQDALIEIGEQGFLTQKNEVLEKLFASQGYDIHQKIDWDSDDEFIKSFRSEMANFSYDYYPSTITFLAKMSIEDYYALRSGEKSMIFEKGECGLFNPIHGNGSSLELELNKPFEIKFTGEEDFFAIQIEGAKENYGYTVDRVYGLVRSAWEDTQYRMETVSKEQTKEQSRPAVQLNKPTGKGLER